MMMRHPSSPCTIRTILNDGGMFLVHLCIKVVLLFAPERHSYTSFRSEKCHIARESSISLEVCCYGHSLIMLPTSTEVFNMIEAFGLHEQVHPRGPRKLEFRGLIWSGDKYAAMLMCGCLLFC